MEAYVFTLESLADPYPLYRRMLAAGGIHRLDIPGGVWAVVRHAECVTLLRDPRLSSRRAHYPVSRLAAERRDEFGEFTRLMSQWMVLRDPPQHARLRKLMNKSFSPTFVEQMRGDIQMLVHSQLDRVEPAGRMDILRDLAYPLPVLVIGRMLSVPAHDHDRLIQWSDDIAMFTGSMRRTTEMASAAQRAICELTDYFRVIVAERRGHPGDDLISLLIRIEEDGDILTEEEVYAQCVMLLFGGHETTRNLIGNGLYSLLRHADQLMDLRANPTLIRSAIEELLRFESPVQAFSRTALEDIEIDQTRIRQGESVSLIVGAANRDPRQFEHPDQLDLRRANNAHLSFGAGSHFCIGNVLARLEGQVAIQTVLGRFPDLRLVDPEPKWNSNFAFRGLRELWVTF